MTEADLTRFWSRVIKSEDCWDWKGAHHNYGYGCFYLQGRNVYAHRVSWLIHNGPIPNNLHVLHHCDNGKCTNPAHLFIGTEKDNMLDAFKKGRHSMKAAVKASIEARKAKTSCKYGHPLSGDNLYLKTNGARDCKICRTQAARRCVERKYANRSL